MLQSFRAVASAILLLAAVSPAGADSVLVLVRHGEKVDESSDAQLSDVGRSRARALAALLSDAGIEAVYSTDYARTRDTARPTAETLSKAVEIYDGDGLEAFAKSLRAKGDRALVVGHSNTTPALVKLLGGDPGAPIADDEYDRIYVLMLSADGRVSTLVLRFPEGVEK
jgi:broad specificity phosphatase PhoE